MFSAESFSAVVLADGQFPTHEVPLSLLRSVKTIVCCDASAIKLKQFGLEPTAIVGDMDSLPADLQQQWADIIYHKEDQDYNDLSKAVNWCFARGLRRLAILGATGLREDHTLGNIGHLVRFARMGLRVRMITDTGVFTPLLESSQLESYQGQQVSIFSPNPKTRITSTGLQYALMNQTLPELWSGTLNCSLSSVFGLDFDPGPLVVYQMH